MKTRTPLRILLATVVSLAAACAGLLACLPFAASVAHASDGFAADTKQDGMSFEECRKTVLTGRPFEIGEPAPPASSLAMLVTHTDVLTKSRGEFLHQRDAFRAAGIGPWSPPSLEKFTASYCGKRVTMKRWVMLTTNTDETYVESGISYFEVWWDVSQQRNFFNDFALTHPAGFSYQGMVPANKTLTADQVIAQLKSQRVPVIMRWNNQSPDGPYTNIIIRLGGVYAEVIIVPGVT